MNKNLIIPVLLDILKCITLHGIDLPVLGSSLCFRDHLVRNRVECHVQVVVTQVFFNLTVRDIGWLDESQVCFSFWTDGTVIVLNQIATVVGKEAHVVVIFILL